MDINSCFDTTNFYYTIAYYAHLIPVALATFLSLYALFKTKFSELSIIFFLFTFFVSLWLLGDLVLWTNQGYYNIYFFWSWLDYVNVVFFALGAYFFGVFARGTVSTTEKILMTALCIPAFILTITGQSVTDFYQPVCEVAENPVLTNYKLFAELAYVVFMIFSLRTAWRTADKNTKIQTSIVLSAILLFFIVFSSTEYIATITDVYEINLYALFVLPLFLIIMVFAITIKTILLGKKSFFLLIIIGLFVINGIWLIPTLRNTRTSASVFALGVVERVTAEINNSLGDAINEIISVAGQITDEPYRTSIIFENLLRYHPIFTSIALVDRSGKESLHIDSSGLFPPDQLIDQSRNTAFYLALQGRTVVTQPVISPDGTARASLVMPVSMQGAFIQEVIIAELNIEQLLSIIESLEIGEGDVYILDRDGVQILNHNPFQILKHQNLNARPIVKKVLVDGAVADGLAETDRYTNDDGEDTFTVGMLVPLVRWGVFYEQPRSQALVGERQTIVLATITSLLGVMIFLVIVLSINKLRELTLQLEKANEHQTSLIHFITHQVKGFLTKTKYIFGELDEGTYGKLSKDVRAIVRQGLQFNTEGVNTVQNVLHAANIRTGKVTYEKKPLDFKTLTEREFERQEKSATDRGLVLTLDAETGDYLTTGDAAQLSNAVRNLIDNAIKYTPTGTVAVTLRKDDDTIQLAVKDSGIGIKEKDREHIFTEGGRGADSAKINVDSTGYGLFIVKGILEAHDGRVWYESEGPGKGTTFFMELPVIE